MKPRRPRDKWAARASAAASFAISATWHFLVLAVLALAVHPLQLPPDNRPVIIELLPPLAPRVELERRRTPSPPEPVEALQPPQPILPKPVQIERPPSPAPPRSTEVQRPPEPVAPEPLETARPLQPILPKPAEVERRPAAVAPKSIVADRPLPQIAPQPAETEPPKTASAPQTSAPLSVLTNERVVQAPVEIRPPDRPSSALRTTVPAVPAVPLPGGAGSASPPGAPAGSAAKPFEGRIVGFDDNGVRTGLRMRLGCVSPDTYHLTPEERTECLRRLADEAKTASAMGPNIPAAKQAEYDRSVACRSSARAGSIPGSSADSSGSIRGLGASPRLRDCGPGDR